MSPKHKPPADGESGSPRHDFAGALEGVRPLGGRDRQVRADKPRLRARSAHTMRSTTDAFEHPDASEPRLAHRASVSAALLGRLASGSLEVGHKLDMHGMRADAAHAALRRALAAAAKERVSVLLIVHGRGKHSGGFAVLRDALPEWLEAEARVLAFAPARTSGDASGATCALLRTRDPAR